jgi:hypothetical protein
MLAFGLILPVALALQAPSTISRRALFTTGAAVTLSPLPALADEVSNFLYGGATAADASVFAGTYTDPAHPGGKRTLTLQSTRLGPYQLARIVGGGGEGEPAIYELPAMVSPTPGKKGSWQITIDFSPKGGPKDFTGYWDGDGIKFPPTPGQIERGNTAGNKWPKVD